MVGDTNMDEVMSNINFGKADPKANKAATGGTTPAAGTPATPAATPAKKGK